MTDMLLLEQGLPLLMLPATLFILSFISLIAMLDLIHASDLSVTETFVEDTEELSSFILHIYAIENGHGS